MLNTDCVDEHKPRSFWKKAGDGHDRLLIVILVGMVVFSAVGGFLTLMEIGSSNMHLIWHLFFGGFAEIAFAVVCVLQLLKVVNDIDEMDD